MNRLVFYCTLPLIHHFGTYQIEFLYLARPFFFVVKRQLQGALKPTGHEREKSIDYPDISPQPVGGIVCRIDLSLQLPVQNHLLFL